MLQKVIKLAHYKNCSWHEEVSAAVVASSVPTIEHKLIYNTSLTTD